MTALGDAIDMAVAETTRSYTISLPPDEAERAEALAANGGRSIDEVVREALRVLYAQQVFRTFDDIAAYAASRPTKYTEEDVPRLIAEVRGEMDAERIAKR
jgi:hypothetical protein